MTDTKEAIKQRTETLVTMTNEFCDKYLDQEYKALSELKSGQPQLFML